MVVYSDLQIARILYFFEKIISIDLSLPQSILL